MKTIKATVSITYEVDGELPAVSVIQDAILEATLQDGGILSSHDESWALLRDSVMVEIGGDK